MISIVDKGPKVQNHTVTGTSRLKQGSRKNRWTRYSYSSLGLIYPICPFLHLKTQISCFGSLWSYWITCVRFLHTSKLSIPFLPCAKLFLHNNIGEHLLYGPYSMCDSFIIKKGPYATKSKKYFLSLLAFFRVTKWKVIPSLAKCEYCTTLVLFAKKYWG